MIVDILLKLMQVLLITFHLWMARRTYGINKDFEKSGEHVRIWMHSPIFFNLALAALNVWFVAT